MHIIREKLLNAIAGGESVNRRLIVVVGLGVAAVVAILVSLNSAKPVASSAAAAPISATVQLPDSYVHIVGEVVKPGIYNLPANSRVFDAVFAAGGFTAKADQGSINLARAIGDGEQILVMAKGANLQVYGSAMGSAVKLVSLNRGNQAELETLPEWARLWLLALLIGDWQMAASRKLTI